MSTPSPESKANPIKEKTGKVAFSVSILFHVGILLMIGGIVLIPAVMQKEAFTADHAVIANSERPMDEPPMEDPSINELPSSQVPPDQMEVPETTATTVPNVDVVITREDSHTTSPWVSTSVGVSAPSFNTQNAIKQGGSNNGPSGEKSKTGLKVVNLFGSQVAANKLGVILDISRSTRTLLDIPLAEIEKNFPDAIIVLVPGCGLDPLAKGEVISADSYFKNKENTKYTSRFYPQNPLEGLLKANKKFEQIWLKAKREKRINIVYLENNTPSSNPKFPVIPIISGSSLAYDFLKKQQVDTIYCFSDFQDPIDPEYVKTLAKELKSSQIKVVQHNFSKPMPPEQFALAKHTGGQIIQKEIKAE